MDDKKMSEETPQSVSRRGFIKGVIAAGAVVSKDVAPYAIVAGNPARTIRSRFASDIAARIQVLAWWDWSHAQLREALPHFRALSAEAFLDRYEPKPPGALPAQLATG